MDTNTKMAEVNVNRTVAIVFNRDSNTFMVKCSYDEYVGVIYGFDDCTNGDVMPISDICDKCYDKGITYTVYDMYDEDCTANFYY